MNLAVINVARYLMALVLASIANTSAINVARYLMALVLAMLAFRMYCFSSLVMIVDVFHLFL